MVGTEMIGRGTWIDKTSHALIEREKRLGRSLDRIRCESGLGASGLPHVGSFGDATRAYGVVLGVNDAGYKAELLAYSDDFDGLRAVPKGYPDSLKKYLAHPVSRIPDPFGCHNSFGSHNTAHLLDVLDKAGFDYIFQSGTDAYRFGLLNKEIIEIMENKDKIAQQVKLMTGQSKYVEIYPYFPICSNCGRIYVAHVYAYDPKTRRASYRCTGDEVKDKWYEGCGFEGEVDVTRGEGKLSWKCGEFAARWRTFDIRFEPYGKDIYDSVRVNDWIASAILNYPAPGHIRYELFTKPGGKKISKTAGFELTPQIWYQYGTPQSLLLLMFKRTVGEREVTVESIPGLMEELEQLEEIYFGTKKVSNPAELRKLRGLYEYCYLLKPPSSPSRTVPYGLLVRIVSEPGLRADRSYVLNRAREYGFDVHDDRELDERISLAKNWVRDFGAQFGSPVSLSPVERRAVQEIGRVLKTCETERDIQNLPFVVGSRVELPASRIFLILYRILRGQESGPRLGRFILALGRQKAIELLEIAATS